MLYADKPNTQVGGVIEEPIGLDTPFPVRISRKDWLNELKNKPCMDCKASFQPWVMDFDHRPGTEKKFCISQGLFANGEDAVMAEIAKCDLVCANCHRVRTQNRLSLSLDVLPISPSSPSDELGRQIEREMGVIPSISPLPSVSSTPPLLQTSSLTPVICDERAIHALLGSLLQKGGLSVSEAARRLGCGPSSLRQYLNGRRSRPSLLWFLRFAAMTGARVVIEFPARQTDGK